MQNYLDFESYDKESILFPVSILNDMDLTDTALNLLMLFYKHRNNNYDVLLTQEDVKEYIGILPQNLSKLIKQLDKYLLVSKINNSNGKQNIYKLKLKIKSVKNPNGEYYKQIKGDIYTKYCKNTELIVGLIKFVNLLDRINPNSNMKTYVQYSGWNFKRYRKVIDLLIENDFIEERVSYVIKLNPFDLTESATNIPINNKVEKSIKKQTIYAEILDPYFESIYGIENRNKGNYGVGTKKINELFDRNFEVEEIKNIFNFMIQEKLNDLKYLSTYADDYLELKKYNENSPEIKLVNTYNKGLGLKNTSKIDSLKKIRKMKSLNKTNSELILIINSMVSSKEANFNFIASYVDKALASEKKIDQNENPCFYDSDDRNYINAASDLYYSRKIGDKEGLNEKKDMYKNKKYDMIKIKELYVELIKKGEQKE